MRQTMLHLLLNLSSWDMRRSRWKLLCRLKYPLGEKLNRWASTCAVNSWSSLGSLHLLHCWFASLFCNTYFSGIYTSPSNLVWSTKHCLVYLAGCGCCVKHSQKECNLPSSKWTPTPCIALELCYWNCLCLRIYYYTRQCFCLVTQDFCDQIQYSCHKLFSFSVYSFIKQQSFAWARILQSFSFILWTEGWSPVNTMCRVVTKFCSSPGCHFVRMNQLSDNFLLLAMVKVFIKCEKSVSA